MQEGHSAKMTCPALPHYSPPLLEWAYLAKRPVHGSHNTFYHVGDCDIDVGVMVLSAKPDVGRQAAKHFCIKTDPIVVAEVVVAGTSLHIKTPSIFAAESEERRTTTATLLELMMARRQEPTVSGLVVLRPAPIRSFAVVVQKWCYSTEAELTCVC